MRDKVSGMGRKEAGMKGTRGETVFMHDLMFY